MSDINSYRVKQWQPQPRPDWVSRVNEEGTYLDIKSIVPLDEDSLINHAKANTGLSDFGTEDWREAFQVFIKSLNDEADLNLMGRIMTRSDILMYLEARLHLEDAYKRNPEINDVELAPHTLVVGSGRSGTSAMQNLLALDPDNGSPRHWETLFPCPAPEAATYFSDPRIAKADKIATQWERVTPEMASVHEFRGDISTELIHLQAGSFMNGGWLIFCGFTPTFDTYLAKRDNVASLVYAKRMLKLMQWKNPHKRWMLKSPDAMRYLPDLFKVFPDMQLVWMHRDPLKTVSSAVNMVGNILWLRSDQALSDAAIAQITNPAGLAGMFNNVIDQMENGVFPAERMRSVQYMDLISDPINTVAQMYRELGYEFSSTARVAMEKYVRENPREARPPHKYSVGDEAKRAEERKLFERYMTKFSVKTEL